MQSLSRQCFYTISSPPPSPRKVFDCGGRRQVQSHPPPAGEQQEDRKAAGENEREEYFLRGCGEDFCSFACSGIGIGQKKQILIELAEFA